MSLIVDASVAVKWFVQEPHSDMAELLIRRQDLIAPTLIIAEVANAFWKRIQRDVSTLDQAIAALEQLPRSFRMLVPSHVLVLDAMRFAVANHHPVHDCFYIMLAEREAAPIVTADRKLASVAERSGISTQLLG
jgi:predicted nucleic acid-binding protein